MRSGQSTSRLIDRIVLVAAAAACYLAVEWILLFTLISFIKRLSFGEAAAMLLTVAFPVLLLAVALQLGVELMALVCGRIFGARSAGILRRAPAISLLAACYFVLIDSALYSSTEWGVVALTGGLQLAGILVFFGFLWFFEGFTASMERSLQKYPSSRLGALLAVFFLIIGTFFTLRVLRTEPQLPEPVAKRTGAGPLPHIILIGSDGVDASHLSLYGYERDTSPFLKSVQDKALVFENVWPNGCTTSNSIPSILTGQLPTETGMLYYTTDLFRGKSQYQNLPWLLRRSGYRTIEIGLRHAVDQYDLNMLDGWDLVNGRSRSWLHVPLIPRDREIHFAYERHFLLRIIDRFMERLLHLAGIQGMERFLEEVNRISKPNRTDEDRLAELEHHLEKAEQPLFLHVHLMGTHGPRFYPETRIFSKDEKQSSDWMIDLYDDAIREFDGHGERLFGFLKSRKLLSNTLVIIYSDHGMSWKCKRVPLLFFFPNEQLRGRRSETVQNLDIAPTIVKSLGFGVPPWMGGSSLREGGLQPARPIIFVEGVAEEELNPVTQNLKSIGLLNCQKRFSFNLEDRAFRSEILSDHTAPCAEADLLSETEAREILEQHVRDKGYLTEG